MDFVTEDMKEGQAAKGREQLHVAFFRKATLDEQKSEAAGMPVFTDRIMVRKLVPGEQTSIIETYAVIDKRHPNADNNLFAKEYAAFLNGESSKQDGVPLAEFPAIVDSQRKTLEYLEVRTVEALAGMADDLGAPVPGFQALKRKAKDFLKAREDASHVLKMSAELLRRDEEIQKRDEQQSVMSAQMAEMKAQLEALQKSEAKKK